MLVNKPKQGFGYRSWRYVRLVINDMTVEHMFVEEGKMILAMMMMII